MSAHKTKRRLFVKSASQKSREREQRSLEEKEDAEQHARSKSLMDRVKELAKKDDNLTLQGIVDVLEDNFRKIALRHLIIYIALFRTISLSNFLSLHSIL